MSRFTALLLLYYISTHAIVIHASEVDDNNKNQHPMSFINGHAVIHMDKEIQQISGLKALRVKEVEFSPEIISFGEAIDINPLLAIRKSYLSAATKLKASKARLAQTEKNITRSRNLHKNEIVSTKNLQTEQSHWYLDKAIYDENEYQKQLILNDSKLQWGELLTQWVLDSHSSEFEKLINGKTTLLKITLPVNQPLPSQIDLIYVHPTGNRSAAFKVTYISTLPQVDNFSQKLQYIFLADNLTIKTGMKFSAWIPQHQQNQRGIIIPESSLAWYLGQSFVFIKIDEEHFIHRTISQPVKTTQGYYVGAQITEGENVVVTGTQMLLSHEFRSQIPDEDDD